MARIASSRAARLEVGPPASAPVAEFVAKNASTIAMLTSDI
jgi:hypothetical protein